MKKKINSQKEGDAENNERTPHTTYSCGTPCNGQDSGSYAMAIKRLKSVAEVPSFDVSYGTTEEDENKAARIINDLCDVLTEVKKIQEEYDRTNNRAAYFDKEFRNHIVVETANYGDKNRLFGIWYVPYLTNLIKRVLDEERENAISFLTYCAKFEEDGIRIFFGLRRKSKDERSRMFAHNFVPYFKEKDNVPLEYW